ncbi:MAG: copper homeostasis protein CutC [Thermoflavifilum sp.]|nr:copper homeostasis protein CutC [Thermoflavifilum sp.]
MNHRYQLEVCVNSFQSAWIAWQAGADRIELCDNLYVGGTTPSLGTIQQVKLKLPIPVFVMIRPRGGDFCYSEEEIEIMKSDIRWCKQLGCEGVVLGLLQENGNIDTQHCRELVELAWPMEVTFHRAFDLTPEPEIALKQILDIGFNYLLSSGRHAQALAGISHLEKLQKQAGEALQIIAAGGIRSNHFSTLLQQTSQIRFFHTGASISSPIRHLHQSIFSLTDQIVDAQEIQAMKQILLEWEMHSQMNEE